MSFFFQYLQVTSEESIGEHGLCDSLNPVRSRCQENMKHERHFFRWHACGKRWQGRLGRALVHSEGLTPRRGKGVREKGRKKWLRNVKMRGKSREILAITLESLWAKVTHQRGPAFPRNEPAHFYLLPRSTLWEQPWCTCSDASREASENLIMISAVDALNTSSRPHAIFWNWNLTVFFPYKCESSRQFHVQNPTSTGVLFVLLCLSIGSLICQSSFLKQSLD